jgi:putative flavoprotein involved in K+ transport
VFLAVGSHTRGVRSHRGRDIFRWLEDTGRNDTLRTSLANPSAAPDAPSLQVVGGPVARDVDLRALQQRGVTLVGRLSGAEGSHVEFADDLAPSTAFADDRLRRLLHSFDTWAECRGLHDLEDAAPVESVHLSATPIRGLDLRPAGIATIVWATGYRRDYSWLDVPVLDRRGELVQTGGITAAPGLYVVGLRFQSRRNSNFIDGVRHDARTVVDHLLARTGERVPVAV